MKINIYDEFSESLRKDWNTLLSKSAVNIPFLKFGYLKQWWKTLGGGEWEDGQLMLMIGEEDGVIKGIAPLFLNEQGTKKIITFVGSKEISDYLDFIATTENFSEFTSAVINYLAKNMSDDWHEIILFNIMESSPLIQLLSNSKSFGKFEVTIEKDLVTPFLNLPLSWEEYMSALDKKQRHEIRRKIRKANQEMLSFDFFFVKSEEEIDQYADTLIELMKYDQQKNEFLSESMVTQMKELLQWGHSNDIAKLFFLKLNEKMAACYFCFDYEDIIWVYNSGFDPAFYNYSPGWVLLGYLIDWAIENGKQKVDFMRGNESYKYRFGAVDSNIYKATIKKK